MINSVNFNPNIAQSRQKTDAPVTQPSFEGNCEMPSEVSSAYRAYGQAILSSKPASAKIIKTIDGREIYENNRISRVFLENENGAIRQTINYYYNDTIPQGQLTLDGFTHKTTPKEYIQYLKENEIHYEIKKDNQKNSISITEFSEDGDIQTTEWSGLGNPTRHILNSKGQEIKTMTFEKDKTIVENYLIRQKIRNIDVKEFPQEKFTKENITNSIRPQDYITYLKQNNKPFRIDYNQNFVEIIELNSKGEEIQSTMWTTAKGEFVPIRTYRDKDGNITQNIIFFKDTTQVEYPAEFEKL